MRGRVILKRPVGNQSQKDPSDCFNYPLASECQYRTRCCVSICYGYLVNIVPGLVPKIPRIILDSV